MIVSVMHILYETTGSLCGGDMKS
ncbi:MAG: hypothetical protein QG671_2709, partial [Actinomycetota bacterium]|nr:hypothetical protein [Actinomycetota bacterium]